MIEAATKLQEEQRLKVRELEQRIEEVRARRDTVRSEIEEMRVEQAGARQEREHLDSEFRSAFGRELPTPSEDPAPGEESPVEAVASQDSELTEEIEESGEPVEEPAPEPTLDELEEELEHAKAALDRIGPVNVLAAHEFAEQEERYSFLTEQRADVNESVKSLRATIKEINETSTDRYLSTFVEVNERFSKTFVELFRGGEAAMRIMDDEDPLESGIEIIARPPGKRPQNINLLSGGEKALTAIALLFALFQTKPSPFCILDEVDAPLDDANVVRFVSVLQQMSRDTQFLVITHNKLTMEAAGTLYGVTMEEKGVSKLVGVQVDQLPAEHAALAG